MEDPTLMRPHPNPCHHPGLTTLAAALLGLLLAASAGGCQFGPSVERHQLIQHQALIDFSGLRASEAADAVRVEASVPASWVLHGVERHALYNHQQWKSPTARTGVGVVYARLPLPLSVDMLLWLGRQQYAKQGTDAKDLGTWTDSVGRKWFEVETNKYHARGYAIADGLDAWIVYMGYKTDAAPEPADVSLAARCVEMFVPVKTGEKYTVPISRQAVTPIIEPAAGAKPATAPSAGTAPATAATSVTAPTPATRPADGGVSATASDLLHRLTPTTWSGSAGAAPSSSVQPPAPSK